MKLNRIVRTAAVLMGTLGVVAGLQVSQAAADTTSDPLSVSASVVKNCKVTTSAVSFSSYDVLSISDTDATGGVSIACTKGVAATVSLSGTNGSRTMAGPSGATLAYSLFSNSGRTTAWDAANPVSYTSLTRAATALTVYARIPKDQDVPVGSYTATVTAAINF